MIAPLTPAFAMPIYNLNGHCILFIDSRKAAPHEIRIAQSISAAEAENRGTPADDSSAPQPPSVGVSAVQLCVPANAEGEGA